MEASEQVYAALSPKELIDELALVQGDITLERAVISFLGRENFDINRYLKMAAASGDLDFVKKCLQLKATDLNGALRKAAQVGDRKMIDFLIERGARNWDTALEEAYRRNDKDLISFFSYRGAVNLQSAARGAARGGHWESLLTILRSNYKFDFSDIAGQIGRCRNSTVIQAYLSKFGYSSSLGFGLGREDFPLPIPLQMNNVGVEYLQGLARGQHVTKLLEFINQYQLGAQIWHGIAYNAARVNSAEILAIVISRYIPPDVEMKDIPFNERTGRTPENILHGFILRGAARGGYNSLIQETFELASEKDQYLSLEEAGRGGHIPSIEYTARLILFFTSRTIDVNQCVLETVRGGLIPGLNLLTELLVQFGVEMEKSRALVLRDSILLDKPYIFEYYLEREGNTKEIVETFENLTYVPFRMLRYILTLFPSLGEKVKSLSYRHLTAKEKFVYQWVNNKTLDASPKFSLKASP